MNFTVFFANPVVKGAIGGALAAAVVDFHAFNGFTDWSNLKSFNWATASFRWFQGAVIGAAAAYGLK